MREVGPPAELAIFVQQKSRLEQLMKIHIGYSIHKIRQIFSQNCIWIRKGFMLTSTRARYVTDVAWAVAFLERVLAQNFGDQSWPCESKPLAIDLQLAIQIQQGKDLWTAASDVLKHIGER